MSSDRYACAECGKYWHELDLYFDDNQRCLCKGCLEKYEAVYLPNTDHKIPMPECKLTKWSNGYTKCIECGLPAELDCDLLCKRCENRMIERSAAKNSPSISPEKTGSAGPDDSHYHKGKMDPWKFIEANNMSFFEGSVIKYVTRWRHKNGIDDLKKARVYIDELIRQAESEIATNSAEK